MTPSWRKPFGMLMIVALIVVWSAVVLVLSPWIERLPALVQLPVYIFFGIVWIMPLKPLLRWMETGAWR